MMSGRSHSVWAEIASMSIVAWNGWTTARVKITSVIACCVCVAASASVSGIRAASTASSNRIAQSRA